MDKLFPGSGSTIQLAFVVDDVDKAMEQWHRTSDAGPFFVFRRISLEVSYRGTPTPLSMSIGLAQLGGVHIELIQQHSPEPSVYRDVYAEGTGGFHHLATLVPDVDAAVAYYESAGFEIGMSLVFGETPVAYVDTRNSIGCMTEVLRHDQAILDLYKQVKDAADGWDGTDPVRDLN